MNVTPLVGRPVPFSNSVCTANGQVIVQACELVAKLLHILYFPVTLLISKLERSRLVKPLQPPNI